MNNLKIYKNGNYIVLFDLSNGTKERFTNEDEFIPSFSENSDVCITKKCDGGCPWCYEGCTESGKHADIMNQKWVDTLHPYTELALNGNDMSHPNLIPFLKKIKDKKVITNLTVNQKHFERHENLLSQLIEDKLIYGLGVSLIDPTDEFIEKIQKYPNAVIHTINGVLTRQQIEKMSDKNLKILILGYKTLRRGINYLENNSEEISSNQRMLYNLLPSMIDKFKVISFDNLAIEQLNVKRMLSDEEWEEFFMGRDGGFTFYIDAVDEKFSKNSTAAFDKRYDLMDSVDDMFKIILNEK